MPELPEVQTTVNGLNKKIAGRKIAGVWFDTPKIIRIIFGNKRGVVRGNTRKSEEFRKIFEKEIKGLKVVGVKRRGKNIIIYLSASRKTAINSYILLVHQKMTGHLLIGEWVMRSGKWESIINGPMKEKVNGYIHVVFYLDNGWQLALSDLRKFAKIVFGPAEEIENLPDLKKLGPDALDKNLTFEKFKKIIGSQKRKIKEILMEQNLIAGIGNIYSDEILWFAKINPLAPANSLSDKKLKELYHSMLFILKKAVKLRGTSISDYRDIWGKPGNYAERRFVYRKEGKPCPRCQTLIKRIKIKSRSAHYCPVCQSLS